MNKPKTRLQWLLAETSQAEVARALGVDRSAVCLWASGKNNPSPRNALLLIKHFGASRLDFEGCYLARTADD